MASYLVTGASRGIGLELVRQLSAIPATEVSEIFAVTRNTHSAELQSIIDGSNKRVINILIKDFLDPDLVQKAADEVQRHLNGRGLDVLVNNAGMAPHLPGGMEAVPGPQLTEVFNANVVTAHLITKAFLPLMRESRKKKLFFMSSVLSSISSMNEHLFVPTNAYKISKTAMNMMIALYAQELGSEGFTCVGIAPGWIKTESSGDGAQLEPKEGVKGVVDLIRRADKSMHGKLMNNRVAGWEQIYDGGQISW